GESPQAEISTTGALALAARIRSVNANVPAGFFIAPAGLTPGILIDKHKVKVAAQHSSRIGRLEVDRMRAAEPCRLTWRGHERIEGGGTMKTVWRVFAYLKRYPCIAAGTLTCAVLSTLMVIVFPAATKWIINDVVRASRPDKLLPLIALAGIAFLL